MSIRKLMARCMCGALSEVPEGPIEVKDLHGNATIIESPKGTCCQCGRVITRKAVWVYAQEPEPKEHEIDLLAVE